MDAPADGQSGVKRTIAALHAVMSAQRFQAIVERVKKQIKIKNEKRSKWIDTERFSFKLFDGPQMRLPNLIALELMRELNAVTAASLAPWRAQAREAVEEIGVSEMVLSGAKRMMEHLQVILAIDNAGFQTLPVSESDCIVSVRPSEPVILVGDDRDMSALLTTVNVGLAEKMQPYQQRVIAGLRQAIAGIP